MLLKRVLGPIQKVKEVQPLNSSSLFSTSPVQKSFLLLHSKQLGNKKTNIMIKSVSHGGEQLQSQPGRETPGQQRDPPGQLLLETLMSPGHRRSNHSSAHTYKKQPREWEPPEALPTEQVNRAWHNSQGSVWQSAQRACRKGAQEGRCHPACSKGRFVW